MPCTYYESPEEKAEAARKARDRRHVELDRVTELLCKVVKELVSEDNETSEDVARAIYKIPGLLKWAAEHAERDEKRAKK